MGLEIKVRRLFVQKKDVPMGCTHRRGSRADVIGDEGRIELERTLAGDLDIGLYPVEYGAQNAEGRERCINVQAHNQIGAGGIGAGEVKLRRLLSCCVFCQFMFQLSHDLGERESDLMGMNQSIPLRGSHVPGCTFSWLPMVKPRTLDLSSMRAKPALTWFSEDILDVLNLDAMKR